MPGRSPLAGAPHLLHGDGQGATPGRLTRLRARLTGRYRALDAVMPPENGETLLHAHFLQDGASILPMALRRNLPLVVTAHGYDATVTAREHARRSEGLWYLALKPFLARRARGIVCVSEWIRQCLLEAGYPPEKLRVIRLGIDLARLPAPPVPERRHGALFVGRLVEKKGVAYLLDAWAALPPPLRAERLTVIGDGPLMPALIARAKRLGLSVDFRGAQPREAVFRAMAEHRLFVMPSIRAANGDSEGLPIVLMEAQAMEMAVVAFDEGPMREAIKPCRSGLLARTRDSEDMAAMIARLLAAPGLAEAMGRAGRAHVRDTFDIRASTAALEDYYDEILARTRLAQTRRAA